MKNDEKIEIKVKEFWVKPEIKELDVNKTENTIINMGGEYGMYS